MNFCVLSPNKVDLFFLRLTITHSSHSIVSYWQQILLCSFDILQFLVQGFYSFAIISFPLQQILPYSFKLNLSYYYQNTSRGLKLSIRPTNLNHLKALISTKSLFVQQSSFVVVKIYFSFRDYGYLIQKYYWPFYIHFPFLFFILIIIINLSNYIYSYLHPALILRIHI